MSLYAASCSTSQSILPIPFVPIYIWLSCTRPTVLSVYIGASLSHLDSEYYSVSVPEPPCPFPSLTPREPTVELSAHDTCIQPRAFTMQKIWQARNRMSAAGEARDPLLAARKIKTAKRRAEDDIIGHCGKDMAKQSQMRQRLNKYVDIGGRLAHLVLHLGLSILLALPASTVQRHQFALRRCAENCGKSPRTIEPSEYVQFCAS